MLTLGSSMNRVTLSMHRGDSAFLQLPVPQIHWLIQCPHCGLHSHYTIFQPSLDAVKLIMLFFFLRKNKKVKEAFVKRHLMGLWISNPKNEDVTKTSFDGTLSCLFIRARGAGFYGCQKPLHFRAWSFVVVFFKNQFQTAKLNIWASKCYYFIWK